MRHACAFPVASLAPIAPRPRLRRARAPVAPSELLHSFAEEDSPLSVFCRPPPSPSHTFCRPATPPALTASPRAGTFGRVLECWDRQENERVAVKIIRTDDKNKYYQAALIEVRATPHARRIPAHPGASRR
jgi:hypothetical protein